MFRVMIIHFTVKTVVDSKFIDDKTGGKKKVEGYCHNTTEESCVSNGSYNEDGEKKVSFFNKHLLMSSSRQSAE